MGRARKFIPPLTALAILLTAVAFLITRPRPKVLFWVRDMGEEIARVEQDPDAQEGHAFGDVRRASR